MLISSKAKPSWLPNTWLMPSSSAAHWFPKALACERFWYSTSVWFLHSWANFWVGLAAFTRIASLNRSHSWFGLGHFASLQNRYDIKITGCAPWITSGGFPAWLVKRAVGTAWSLRSRAWLGNTSEMLLNFQIAESVYKLQLCSHGNDEDHLSNYFLVTRMKL